MENWRRVWRIALSKILPREGMKQLKLALENDDSRLIQGATCSPPPLQCVMDWEVQKADAITFCFWQNTEEELLTVGECESGFAKACFMCDNELGEPGGVRWFLNWWDDTPREVAISLLLGELRDYHGKQQSTQLNGAKS